MLREGTAFVGLSLVVHGEIAFLFYWKKKERRFPGSQGPAAVFLAERRPPRLMEELPEVLRGLQRDCDMS